MQASKRIADEIAGLYAALLKKQPPEQSQLERPTFRFILSFVIQLMSKCGILKDIFTPQDVEPARLKDRRAKLAFLNKLIEYAASNRQPAVGIVAVRILDGQEPNKTLELVLCLLRIAQQRILSNSNPIARRQRTFTTKPDRQKLSPKSLSNTSRETTDKKPQVANSVKAVPQNDIKLTEREAEPRDSLSPNQAEIVPVVVGQTSPILVETGENLSTTIPHLRQALKSLHVSLSQGNEARRLAVDMCQREMSCPANVRVL